MKMIQLYQDIEIAVKELQADISPLHRHNFFELIYVLEGTGIHRINENNYNYVKGNVFLLTPDDAHTFEVSSNTRFCIIDFTKSLFSKSSLRTTERMDFSDFFIKLEYIFHNHHHVKGDILNNENDRKLFEVLVLQLIAEKEKEGNFYEIIIQNIVFLLLYLIARNIQQGVVFGFEKGNPKNKVHEITTYIQQNIYSRELIKIENLALQFNKSTDHLGRYFKKQTGITLKNYIMAYKLNLIKTRLKYSDLTISEIADEMNFTDDSHLNKVFKKIFGKTAKQYRKEVLA